MGWHTLLKKLDCPESSFMLFHAHTAEFGLSCLRSMSATWDPDPETPHIDVNEVTRLKTHFNLQPHPEGGFYAETYRSTEMVATPRGDRSASTSVYKTWSLTTHTHKIYSVCWLIEC